MNNIIKTSIYSSAYAPKNEDCMRLLIPDSIADALWTGFQYRIDRQVKSSIWCFIWDEMKDETS